MIRDFRLFSTIENGINGAECYALDLIYICLLREFGQNAYTRIAVNQSDDVNEAIIKDPGNRIHCNIRYPSFPDFFEKSPKERNLIRLDCIHTALLRIAAYDKKLEVDKLENIKNKILKKNFSFEFLCKAFPYAKDKGFVAKIIVNPQIDKFVYYLQVEVNNLIKCKIEFFNGITANHFGEELFNTCKWINNNQLVIYSKNDHEVDIFFLIDACSFEIKNLTTYENPPMYTTRRADITKVVKDKANEDWLSSRSLDIQQLLRSQPSPDNANN
ncbi:MAG: hypothetical protein DI598_11815 [Pseudopedobacter saltans]|uniref:Uncharacterized protein n=1 Tax=Pseudopedobacter saltans TaxID=151895 RepID=A0A2W5GTM1_9SPHI|nr:MAG: hypothetical protein DI598_11815 [Pseudopedobacter saltans]